MESFLIRENIRLSMEDAGNMDEASSQNFQKFIYELFDKNGVLNDLRAYLRGHIVNVLKSAQTGENSVCQKLFTQRLELIFQTLNILIAEYLLKQGFNYSLSVFISEIPLSNMVFAFAKKLLDSKSHMDNEVIRFNNSDICSALNYLGVQCDSADMINVLDMYNSVESPSLLVCIVKCMQHHYGKPSVTAGDTCSEKTSKTCDDNHKLPVGKCRHYENCKICQNRERKVTENLKKRSRKLETMVQQLKSEYHTELESARREERAKIDDVLQTHAHQLHQRTDEIERQYKAREAELERGVADKKRFLWGLARSLKEQHSSVADAIAAVRDERRRLAGKECSLKNQLKHAEEVFIKRGEELRSQILSELATLETHLDVIKKEREALMKERSQLENSRLKARQTPVKSRQEKIQYDELKNELADLKRYLESSKQPKLMLEVATLTEESYGRGCLNNMECYKVLECPGSSRIQERNVDALNKVVNDLKKLKNVNFNAESNAQVMEGLSTEKKEASLSPFNIPRELGKIIEQLQADNQHLRDVAAQQGAHVETLSSQQARLRAELAAARCALLTPPANEAGSGRPRSSPAPQLASNARTLHLPPQRNTAASSRTVAQGGGEGAALFVQGERPPRILVPGDEVPFCGPLSTRTETRRRPLISRRLTRHLSPSGSKQAPNAPIPAPRFSPQPISVALFTHAQKQDTRTETTLNDADTDKRQHDEDDSKPKTGKRSPKGLSISKNSKKREKSPSSVLREAKMRLRKLEIEAEAVEKSYATFKNRQNNVSLDQKSAIEEEFVTKVMDMEDSIDMKRSRSVLQVSEQSNNISNVNNCKDSYKNIFIDDIAKQDFEKHLKGVNIPEIKTPKVNETRTIKNLLLTPLLEFRKYYQFDHNLRQKIGSAAIPAKSKKASSPMIPLNIQKNDDLKVKHNDNVDIFEHNSIHKIASFATILVKDKEDSSPMIPLNIQKNDDLKEKHNDNVDTIDLNSIHKIGSATIPSKSNEDSSIIPLNIQKNDDLQEKRNDYVDIIDLNSVHKIGSAPIPSKSNEDLSPIIPLDIKNNDDLKENHNEKVDIIEYSSENIQNTKDSVINSMEYKVGAESENELLLFRKITKAGETDISIIKINNSDNDSINSTPKIDNEKEEIYESNNNDIIEVNINLNFESKEIENSYEKIEANDSANETTDLQDFSIDMDNVSKTESPISIPNSEQDNFWGA